jgi:predicted negative regulator of RcsB-dependent stress response
MALAGAAMCGFVVVVNRQYDNQEASAKQYDDAVRLVQVGHPAVLAIAKEAVQDGKLTVGEYDRMRLAQERVTKTYLYNQFKEPLQ